MNKILKIFSLILYFVPLILNAQNPSDLDITERVEWEFAIQHGITQTEIDVSTENGIVQLNGNLSTLLAKERAVNIAQEVKGVLAVVDNLVVVPASVPDAEIKSNVEKRIKQNKALEGYQIDVAVYNALVSLDGTLESYLERDLADMIVRDVQGVRDLDNGLTIYISRNRPDYELWTGVAERLRWDINVDDQLIDVSANAGVIKLSGVVGSLIERNNAYSDAWIAGVKAVDTTQLKVHYWAKDEALRKGAITITPDREVRRALRSIINDDIELHQKDIDWVVNDGKVAFDGEVNSLKAKQKLEDIAYNIVGVWYVDNQVAVKPLYSLSDAQLRQNLYLQLKRNPFTQTDNYTIEVMDGIVFLHGEVNSYFERQMIKEDVLKVAGVKGMQSSLDIGPYPQSVVLSDAQLERLVRDRLYMSPNVREYVVNVDAKSGIVTLSGKVATQAEKRAAINQTYWAGDVEVVDQLKLMIPSERSR